MEYQLSEKQQDLIRNCLVDLYNVTLPKNYENLTAGFIILDTFTVIRRMVTRDSSEKAFKQFIQDLDEDFKQKLSDKLERFGEEMSKKTSDLFELLAKPYGGLENFLEIYRDSQSGYGLFKFLEQLVKANLKQDEILTLLQ